ncbi:hypothetical protein GCM10010372_50820 [Streptomyces tauricus]|uniref:transposase n=1 Tax=Streptomyces tauricus TaxID=68274 RepID=UPI0019ADB693|nr:transposase [Streptomyces tauricus]GHA44745.1 hypothetical protein GCM10010372_50820 [Streptomyces tauricus]
MTDAQWGQVRSLLPVPGRLRGQPEVHRHRAVLDAIRYLVDKRWGTFIVFEDEAWFGMTAARARTWGRRGQTLMVRVRGRSWRRYSVAALCCYRPGESSRLLYRPRRHHKYRQEVRNSFAWTDHRDLIVRAHIQLKAPIVLIWDNLNTHRAVGMRQYAVEHDWLTVVQLPSHAPELNLVEGVWSLLRRGPLANFASGPSGLDSRLPVDSLLAARPCHQLRSLH